MMLEKDNPSLIRIPSEIAEKSVTPSDEKNKLLRVRASIDAVQDAVYWINEQGRFFDVNTAACRTLGYSREELLQMGPEDISTRFKTVDWQSHWEELLQIKQKVMESEHRTRNGDIFPVEVSVTFQEFRGHPFQLALARDISERKQAEEALHISRQIDMAKDANLTRMRLMLENMPVMVHAQSADGTLTFWNKECERVLGYTKEEILGNSRVFEMFYPDERKRSAVIELHSRPSDFTDIEIVMTAKDGTEKIIRFSSISESCPVPGWHTWEVGYDVTDRIEQQRELSESEARFKAIFEKSNAVKILIQSDTGRILDANPAACRFYGYSYADITDMKISQINISPENEVQKKMEETRIFEAGSFEFQHRKSDGSIVDVLVNSNPIDIGGSTILHSIITDITEQKYLEKIKEDVDRILQHNLKSSISSFTYLPDIIDINRLEEGDREIIYAFQKSGRKMLATIHSTLALHRIEKGIYENPQELIDVLEELTILQAEVKPFIEVKNQSFQIILNGKPMHHTDVCVMRGDSALIPNAFMNLVNNAIEAAPENSAITIRIHTGDGFSFSVTNQGSLPPEIKERFFEKYMTYGKTHGTGLGTYCVKQIARAHGGDARLETSENEGITVTVFLPRDEKTCHEKTTINHNRY